MKKIIILSICLLILVCGCFKKDGQIICTLTLDDKINNYDITSNYIINYEDDFVKSVITTETLTSDDDFVIENIYNNMKASHDQIKDHFEGYEYKITRNSNSIVLESSNLFEEDYVRQFVIDNPSLKLYYRRARIKYTGLKNMYENKGAACK